MSSYTRGNFPEIIFPRGNISGDNFPGGNLPGGNLVGGDLPRGNLVGAEGAISLVPSTASNPLLLVGIYHYYSLDKKPSFPLRISSVNVTKLARNYGLGHI